MDRYLSVIEEAGVPERLSLPPIEGPVEGVRALLSTAFNAYFALMSHDVRREENTEGRSGMFNRMEFTMHTIAHQAFLVLMLRHGVSTTTLEISFDYLRDRAPEGFPKPFLTPIRSKYIPIFRQLVSDISHLLTTISPKIAWGSAANCADETAFEFLQSARCGIENLQEGLSETIKECLSSCRVE